MYYWVTKQGVKIPVFAIQWRKDFTVWVANRNRATKFNLTKARRLARELNAEFVPAK